MKHTLSNTWPHGHTRRYTLVHGFCFFKLFPIGCIGLNNLSLALTGDTRLVLMETCMEWKAASSHGHPRDQVNWTLAVDLTTAQRIGLAWDPSYAKVQLRTYTQLNCWWNLRWCILCNGSGAVVHLLQCARGLGLQLPFGIAELGMSLWRHFHLHIWFYSYHTNVGKVFRSTSQWENFLHRFVKPLCSYLVQKPELHTITITHTPLVTYTVITS